MNCCAKEVVGDPEQDRKNREIAKTLREDKSKMESEIRLLLLGAGESGKSTVAKQMKVIHMGGFAKEERESYVSAIHANIYESIQNLMRASEDLGVEIQDESVKSIGNEFLEPFPGKLDLTKAKDISKFWADPNIKEIYKRRNEFQLTESAAYYLDKVEKILVDGFLPDEQDILRSRVTTTGIIETKFTVGDANFVIVDVGGQRSERKKWMHCFENVTGVLFCVGISEFDNVLFEDHSTNRILEALKLFHEICQSKWFTNTLIILFLNKDDVFKEKLKNGKSISCVFSDFKGGSDYDQSIKFLESKFTNIKDPVTGELKEIVTHVTTATNTNNVKVVFEAVKESVLNKALYASGIV
eukprot:TRINITY_DN34_c0_g1_i1.p1 TRINITY_DN34_c0_g1~~TRINITY_DN34_c0_g1_i1.p1  ORF type:complete len:356 (-),score=77.76 TRINITY_DN34_c0_g1_i1:99-1166(-)